MPPRDIKQLHSALRDAAEARSPLPWRRVNTDRTRQAGKLAYVLSENLHANEEQYSKAATEAMVRPGLVGRNETRRRAAAGRRDDGVIRITLPSPRLRSMRNSCTQRPEIEAAVARAWMCIATSTAGMCGRRCCCANEGRRGEERWRFANGKHGGQPLMIRRLQPERRASMRSISARSASRTTTQSFGAEHRSMKAPVLDAFAAKDPLAEGSSIADRNCNLVTRRKMWGGARIGAPSYRPRRTPEDAARSVNVALAGVHDVLSG